MRFVYIFTICALCALFNACSNDKIITIPATKAKDLHNLPQNALHYVQKAESKRDKAKAAKSLNALKKDYLAKFFSPWHEGVNKKTSEVFWIKPSLLKTPGFGEHLQENDIAYTKAILDNMGLKNYPNANKKAIITTTTAVRAVPTHKPMFNKSSGYPFDRWQNSLIFLGTPVLITHISQDKRFFHIQSGFVYGWVDARHVATLDNAQIKAIESAKSYVVPLSDNVSVLDSANNFITEARIGQIFAVQSAKNTNENIALVVYLRLPNGKAKQSVVYAKKSKFSAFPMIMSESSIATLINATLKQRYGWGGLLENRDCSALVRDIFATFGLHLPRNSKAQAYYAKNSIDISKLNRAQKEAFIIENATPFKTLLWQSGHIMLYLGSYENRAIIAHSVWSIKSGKIYENMLGGVVISSLYVGDEYNSSFKKTDILIDKIASMSDLGAFADTIIKGTSK